MIPFRVSALGQEKTNPDFWAGPPRRTRRLLEISSAQEATTIRVTPPTSTKLAQADFSGVSSTRMRAPMRQPRRTFLLPSQGFRTPQHAQCGARYLWSTRLGRVKNGTRSASAQTAATTRPPSTMAPREFARAATGESKYISPQRTRVELKHVAGGPSGDAASITRNSRFVRPSQAALSLAIESMLAEMSTLSTDPLGPTRRAAEMAGSPRPVARSSTRIPGPTPAKRSIRSLNGAGRSNRSNRGSGSTTHPGPVHRARARFPCRGRLSMGSTLATRRP